MSRSPERSRDPGEAPAAEDWVRIGTAEELTGAGPFAATAGDTELVLVRTRDGLRAFEGRCPHQGALLAEGELVGDELVWDRGFGRPANAVVLPAGWVLTNSSIPATVSTMPDGRVRLDFINPRPDEIQVLITARRR